MKLPIKIFLTDYFDTFYLEPENAITPPTLGFSRLFPVDHLSDLWGYYYYKLDLFF